MAITTTDKGSNSCEITFLSTDTTAGLMDAMGTWLLSHGWALHDGGTYRVYKALCKDGTTYKYLRIFLYSTNAITFRVYESWNETTHVGTNEAGYFYSQTPTGTVGDNVTYSQIPTTTGGTIRLFATNRYAAYSSDTNVSVVASKLAGVFEWSVDNPDTGTLPFGWCCMDSVLGSYLLASTAHTTSSLGCISPVKIANTTGVSLGRLMSVSVGSFNQYVQCSTNVHCSAYSQFPTTNDPVTNYPYSYTLKVYKYGNATGVTGYAFLTKSKYLGRIYGLKVIAGAISVWLNGDTCNISIDADGFQVETGGTSTAHCIMKNPNTTSPLYAVALPV